MNQSARGNFSGPLAFVLAAAGSAVGLGNLWKFPYIAWNNHGGAFVLVYLACICLIGMPIMMAEIQLGRRAMANPVPALEKLGGKGWSLVGWLGVLAGIVILSFYAVIAGWSISSFAQCVKWSLNGYVKPAEGAFGAFVGSGGTQIALTFIFLACTGLAVAGGVAKGIERTTRILMPILFVIMIYLCINVAFLSGFGEALGFLFKPDFASLEPHSVLEALGHAFFTLSLGMGAMLTYGSYMKKEESIPRIASYIVVLDTVIALIACVIMYSIIFSSETMQEILAAGSVSTVAMLFVTIPEMIYTHVPGGVLVGPIFYILVGFAALTSTISLLEVIVSLLVDKKGMDRKKATLGATFGLFILGVANALSLGANDFLTNIMPFGSEAGGLNRIFVADKAGVLQIFDHVSANWLLPLGGFFLTLFVGWFYPIEDSLDELGMRGPDGEANWQFKLWLFLIRFVAPVAIGAIIVAVLLGRDFS